MKFASLELRTLPVEPALPDEQALSDLRRAITCEAVALVQQTVAAAKKRRDPIPFPVWINVEQRASAISETLQPFGNIPMHNPPVNPNAKAAEPGANSTNPEPPASPAGNNPRPRRNWAELLAQKRPAGRTVTPLAVIVATASEASGQKQSPSHEDVLQTPLAETEATHQHVKTWEQVQSHVFAEIPLPSGIHDGYILSRLAQSRRPISGLVVCIGISAPETPGSSREESIPAGVRNLIRSLLGPHDFACASAPDEYLLIFPQDQGAAAQRRLGEVARKLWDFQLQMLGRAAILFSWGGVEVRGESIDEAIASASDRMQETRRTRSARSLEKHGLRIAG